LDNDDCYFPILLSNNALNATNWKGLQIWFNIISNKWIKWFSQIISSIILELKKKIYGSKPRERRPHQKRLNFTNLAHLQRHIDSTWRPKINSNKRITKTLCTYLQAQLFGLPSRFDYVRNDFSKLRRVKRTMVHVTCLMGRVDTSRLDLPFIHVHYGNGCTFGDHIEQTCQAEKCPESSRFVPSRWISVSLWGPFRLYAT